LSPTGRDTDMFAATMGSIIDANFACNWVVAMVDGPFMRFLPDRAHNMDPFRLWPRYCSGHVYRANVFDSLIAQAFYNDELIDITSRLLGSSSTSSSTARSRG